MAAIRREDIKPESHKYFRVCSDHFVSGKPSLLYDDKNPHWVLILNLGVSCDPKRAKLRGVKRRTMDQELYDEERVDDGPFTVTGLTQSDLATLEHTVSGFQSQINDLKKLSQECFEQSDMLVNFYTGLPNWEILSVLLAYVIGDLTGMKSSLTPFQQQLLLGD